MVTDPKTIPAAFEAGINFFFLSGDLHWPHYEASRRGLAMLLSKRGVRDRIVVAVVSYVTQPAFCHIPFIEVLDALPALKRIDLSIIGGTHGYEFLVRLDEYRHHRSGARFPATRALGATFHDRRAAAYATAHGLVDIAYCRYNPLHRGAEVDLFPFVATRPRTLLYNFKSADGHLPVKRLRTLGLSKGYWHPGITDYYRFALTRPELDGLLCSPSTPKEVHGLVRALESGPLSEEESRYLCDVADLDQGKARLARSTASP